MMNIPRMLSQKILDLVPKGKIILMSGPRQAGKTHLSQKLFAPVDFVYLNFDDPDDRVTIRERSWPKDVRAVLFDELHKMDKWKTWLKALYDKGSGPPLIVTGSARMETFKKGGDSLAGRHFHFRLHPLMLGELLETGIWKEREALDRLMEFGGFPEPLIEGDPTFLKLWHKSHIHQIIKEDILDLEKVRELKKIELLIELLSQRVGSRISYASLAQSLEVSPHTVKHWLQILENLYVVFKLLPFTRKLPSSLLKSPKYYFFDTSQVRGGPGAKLENLVASQLLAQTQFLEDTLGESVRLHFLADKQKHEVDFAIIKNERVDSLIEVKLSDRHPSPSLKYFSRYLRPRLALQALYDQGQEKHFDHLKILSVEKALLETITLP
ncbi:MAG: ATP-binding protein [Bacteriovoracales bacterium]|nr:ATP-binding protein [Bacteriovoracales bacterium]